MSGTETSERSAVQGNTQSGNCKWPSGSRFDFYLVLSMLDHEQMQPSVQPRVASAAWRKTMGALSLHNIATVICTIKMELIAMQSRLRWILTLFFLFVLALRVALYAQPAPPVINKIDPPNWWPALPDPMLLIYGRNLNGAQFGVTGPGVRIVRSQASANGHYAFLWLATKQADPQNLQIDASNTVGSTKAEFRLQARVPGQRRYQGVNPADVIYLVMTDRFADGDRRND